MKRFTMVLAMVLMVTMPLFAERVTPETAHKVAATFLSNNGAKSVQQLDIVQATGLENLYIINAEQGFVIMAADDRVQPILGYSLSGDFTIDDMPDDVVWWLRGYNIEIQSAIDNGARASHKITKQWQELAEGNSRAGKATTAIAPLIQTKWNQNKYYNRLCPIASGGPDGHAYAGCVATAMAQIMKYWSYPSTGIGSHSYTWNGQTLNANFGATTYDWNNMADYYEYYYANGTDQYVTPLPEPSAEEIAAVATLMYHCGVSVNMNYGGGGSGAYSSDVAPALRNYFNYSSTVEYKQKSYTNTSENPWVTTTFYSDSEWIAILKNELDALRPIVYGGADPNASSGHSFVCDGYDSRDYFHFNWGWSGHYNGYFTITNLNTGANTESGSGNGNYTRDQDITIGIQPGSMVDAPTNLTFTLSGLNDITLTWNGVSAASSYNVYCDGNLVGNTTSTTYSETAPFGTHEYFVRCVDANSQLSLPSNTVTVTIAYQTPVVTDLTATLSGNNANLSWTAPAWCYPETPSATLTYGDGNYSGSSVGFNNGSNMYWGHRYLSSNLTSYNNMIIYKAAFYAKESGAYSVFVYEETQSGRPKTKVLEQSLQIETIGWYEFDLSTQIVIDASKDYWVFMYDPAGRNYPATFTQYSGNEGNYYSAAITSRISTYNNAAFLIKTYLTDGTYTYNLYDGTTTVASNISNTSYTVNNITNNVAHQYTLKTNYNGNETDASNMVGFSLGNASINNLSLAANDKMTVTEGSRLTVSGTLSDVNAANLIIEDGGQLITNNSVAATVQKTVKGFDDNMEGGWKFIASPVQSISINDVSNLISEKARLYKYDEPTYFWRYYSGTGAPFTTLTNQVGYLYGNENDVTLSFAGTITPSSSVVSINDLSYTAEDNPLAGWNLVGNPFTCNAYTNKSYYVTSYDSNEPNKTILVKYLASQNVPIPPCTGILVQADSEDKTIRFANSSYNIVAKNGMMQVMVSQANMRGSSMVDKAIVSFNAGDELGKFVFNADAAKLYIPQNGKDYAIVSSETQGEMPVNFKAKENGTYTLSIDVEGMEMKYLHLIDNKTGNDVDLLQTPSYSFEAKTTDYESRFKLVFVANNEESVSAGSETFAFFSNGSFVINNEGNAELQVIDITGRIVKSESINGCANVNVNAAPGVYMLRLINGNNLQTQKIIIE